MKPKVNTSYLKQYGQKLIDNGYQIVPIPPGFKYPKNHPRWQKTNFNKILPKLLANGSADAFVSIKLGYGVCALDFDIRDEKTTNLITDWCLKNIGVTPIRYGDKPKAMMFFKTDELIKKRTSPMYVDLFGNDHQIEILGIGQQALVYAIHPKTGKPYEWNDSGIADIHKSNLPLITPKQIDQLFNYLDEIKPNNWKVKEVATSTNLNQNPLLNLKSQLNISVQKIKDTLSNIDPDSEYHTWAKIGMALYHQFDGDVQGFELWDHWSRLGSKYNSSEMEHKWSTFKANIKTTNPVTFASVLHMVKDKIETKTTASDIDVGFKLIHAGDVMAKLGPIDWAVENYFESNTFGVLYGAPGSYKSFIAIDIALHIATDQMWHGNAVKQGPAILIEGEGHQGLARRLAGWSKAHSVNLLEHPVYVSKAATAFLDMAAVNEVYQSVKNVVNLTGQNPAVIVIDTLARNFGPGDENSTADMSQFIKMIDIIRSEFECLVMVVHHTGRTEKNRARGSMALDGGADFIYQIDKPKDMAAELICKKMKDAIEPEKTYFEAQSVLIDMSEDQEITSLVFDKTDAPIEVQKALKGNQELLYKLIQKHTFEGSVDRKHITEMAILESLYKSDSGVRKTLNRLENSGHIRLNDNEIIDLGDWS